MVRLKFLSIPPARHNWVKSKQNKQTEETLAGFSLCIKFCLLFLLIFLLPLCSLYWLRARWKQIEININTRRSICWYWRRNIYLNILSQLERFQCNAILFNIGRECRSQARLYIITVLTLNLTFRESHVVNEVDLVLVVGVEGDGVVLDDAAVEDPLDSRDRITRDLTVESSVGPRSANHLEILNRKFYQ